LYVHFFFLSVIPSPQTIPLFSYTTLFRSGTYPGRYIPSPIEIRLFSYDESPEQICNEILALTKMNWNNTQFDRKFPITIDCSRRSEEHTFELQSRSDLFCGLFF